MAAGRVVQCARDDSGVQTGVEEGFAVEGVTQQRMGQAAGLQRALGGVVCLGDALGLGVGIQKTRVDDGADTGGAGRLDGGLVLTDTASGIQFRGGDQQEPVGILERRAQRVRNVVVATSHLDPSGGEIRDTIGSTHRDHQVFGRAPGQQMIHDEPAEGP